MNSKISIVIPVYNAEKTIIEALDSIKNQSFQKFEVLIIDDGSTDDTKQIISKYFSEDNRFRYYYQENAGPSVARNNGISKSKSSYICFLDSDDYYDDTYLEKMLYEITIDNSNICYCGYKFVSKNEVKIRKSKFISGNIVNDFILGKILVSTNGWLIKKEILLDNFIEFSEDLSWGEDFEFFCKILSLTDKVCYVPEYLTNYRVNIYNDRLSEFSLDKLNKDYECINRILGNENINKNTLIQKSLCGYRMPALLTYRLLEGIERGEDKIDIIIYYNQYKKDINKILFNNGLRSFKLAVNIIKLKLKIKLMY